MMKYLGMLLVTGMLSASAVAEDTPDGFCHRFPLPVVAPCFTVHGRLSAYNGSTVFRIWVIGTRRLLGVPDSWVLEADEVEATRRLLTANVIDAQAKGVASSSGFVPDVYGDFTVCPFTVQKPGVMQLICIASATHMHTRPRESR